MRGELERAGVRCLDMNYERLGGWSKRIAYQHQFLRMLRRERISALHVHHATALILGGIPARLAKVRRVVMTEHGLYQLKERPSYRRSAARYCRFASDITVVEPSQADYFHAELGVPQRKLHYVPNGVRVASRTPDRVERARAALGLSPEMFAYFYVGRLSPVKDLGTLLGAFAELPLHVSSRSKLYLAGDGTERKALEEICNSLRLSDRVQFLGARDDVSDLLMAADAFVMSSTTEGLPMAMLEAMAGGVPCAATAVGGIPDLLSEGRGLVVPARSSQKLAFAMSQLAESPELRKSITVAARKHVSRHYSLDAVVDRYLELLCLPRHNGS